MIPPGEGGVESEPERKKGRGAYLLTYLVCKT